MRQRANRPWDEYPIGTLAHAIMGGSWERVERGWMWRSSGCVFPTPGGDAFYVTVPDTTTGEG